MEIEWQPGSSFLLLSHAFKSSASCLLASQIQTLLHELRRHRLSSLGINVIHHLILGGLEKLPPIVTRSKVINTRRKSQCHLQLFEAKSSTAQFSSSAEETLVMFVQIGRHLIFVNYHQSVADSSSAQQTASLKSKKSEDPVLVAKGQFSSRITRSDMLSMLSSKDSFGFIFNLCLAISGSSAEDQDSCRQCALS